MKRRRSLLRRLTRNFRSNKMLWFDHFLALKFGKTVEEMNDALTFSAYYRWVVYFAMESQQKELHRPKR